MFLKQFQHIDNEDLDNEANEAWKLLSKGGDCVSAANIKDFLAKFDLKLPGLVRLIVQVLVVDVLELLQEHGEVHAPGLACIGDPDQLSNLLRGGGATEIRKGLLELLRFDGASLVVIEKSEGLLELLDLILRQVSHYVRHGGVTKV